MVTTPPTWHVLGAGALGSLLAAQLQASAIPVQLLGRPGSAAQLRKVQLARLHTLPVAAVDNLPAGSIRYLLIVTKAWAVAEALRDALSALHPDAIIACCANGLGFEGEAAAVRPGTVLLRAVSTEAAHRQATQVCYAGEGETLLGDPRGGSAPPWFQGSLGGAGHWRWTNAIEAALWRKFAINCVINPLTAAHRCRNGELLERRALRRELADLAQETQAALRQLRCWRDAQTLEDTVIAICEATADNRSSMLQDCQARRRTEIDYLNGHLLRQCAALGLVLPHNARLYMQLGNGAAPASDP